MLSTLICLCSACPTISADAAAVIRFDFNAGDLQGWHVVAGQPPQPVRGKADQHYLSTRAVAGLGPGDMTLSAQGVRAVIESPVFLIEGPTISFRLGGFAGSKSAYLALFDLDGKELRRAWPTGKRGGSGILKSTTWDVASLLGKRVYLRMIDRAGTNNGGYVELDDFVVEGTLDACATKTRQEAQGAAREAALLAPRRELAKIGKIVFAVREPGKNGHWYANFGHWSTRPDYKLYGKGGRLCVLTVKRGEGGTLVDDPDSFRVAIRKGNALGTGFPGALAPLAPLRGEGPGVRGHGIRSPLIPSVSPPQSRGRREPGSAEDDGVVARHDYALHALACVATASGREKGDRSNLPERPKGCCAQIGPVPFFAALDILIDDPEGTIRDPQVHYDAERILFSYRPGGTEYFHLYEINVDGSNLRQLTDGPYDDIEPSYLPDGRIIFCSSRCKRWVPCHWVEVATLHTCRADGSNIRAISANVEQENTPWPMPDGRVLYTRWEYIDRSVTQFHHLWTSNPDGTGQMVFFGNMHPGGLFIDAKPIGSSGTVVFVNSPGHGRLEHAGTICTVDSKAGPDARSQIQEISWSDNFRDPYPLGAVGYLTAQNTRIVLMSPTGHAETVYELPESDRTAGLMCHEPRVIQRRPREASLVDRVDREKTSGRLLLTDVYESRNLDGVSRGQIKKLLVLEVLPKALNASYGPEPISVAGAHNLERILGTVPVQPDGSAYFEVPAMRPLFFVALDEDGRAVKRMQSFFTVQPGETLSCVGCHEHRANTPPVSAGEVSFGQRANGSSYRRGAMLAAQAEAISNAYHRGGPAPIKPLAGLPDIIDFPRDIQPLLDRHCVACHDYQATTEGGPRAGGVVLTGDRGPLYTHSYVTLHSERGLVRAPGGGKGNTPAYANGSGASRLPEYLDGSHHGVQLGQRDQTLIRLWLDVGAPFAGTNAAEASGMFRRFPERLITKDQKCEFGPRLDGPLPSAAAVYQRRCASCHRGSTALAVDAADTQGGREWSLGPGGPRRRYASHLAFNLSRPAKSTVLLAPLAKEAGGYGICGSKRNDQSAKPIFADTQDRDYQQLLSFVQQSKAILDRMTRFDMPNFVPSEHYVREMKRYGFISQDWQLGDPIDVYAIDRAYWESFYPGSTPQESSN